MRPGLRDELVTQRLLAALDSLGDRALREPLDRGDAARRLARHIAALTQRRLDALPEADGTQDLAELTNSLISKLDPEDRIALPPEVLYGVLAAETGGLAGAPGLPPRPEIPLSTSDLLFNGKGQPSIGSELKSELRSADRVDLICAFVIWTGVRVLLDGLRDVLARGGDVHVITTTYMGATEPQALNALVDAGVDVKVAFDARTTKLHAKSWLIEREGDLTTAFIGSSNLSHTALHEGLEWNVRLSAAETPSLIARIKATFDTYWADEHFETYTREREGDLRRSLGDNQRRRTNDRAVSFFGLDVHPYPYQRRILERLAVERERHDRHRNLVIAATGTGKTVVAALDYRDLRARLGGDPSLLFVAHRRQILDQSLQTFRAVLRRGDFGEILGDGEEPAIGRHVFAMVQSLTPERIERIAADAYDVVIVDEFHHAKADSYTRLLDHLQPRELVGMTATPERMDGQDVTEWFGGRIAYELRLWDAIDQGFLSPFQYFGVSDGTDLSRLEWRRGGYVTADLEALLVNDRARVAKLLEAIEQIVDEPQTMKALGFCVSVEHAQYMARYFDEAGLRSVAISGQTPTAERDHILNDLSEGRLRAVFSVDVLGEGVDVPAVDTVLLLRPTQSATVLSQQLGRGLRLAEGKRCLTIIDLIGQQHRAFRFDRRLRALVDPKLGPVRRQIEEGFPLVPAGCDVSLDRVARDIVLDNLRASAVLGQWRALVEDLIGLGDVSLASFLSETARAPTDLYRGGDKSWTTLRRAAGLSTAEIADDREESILLRALSRLMHVDDAERISFYSDLLDNAEPPQVGEYDPRRRRLLAMLHFDLWGVNNAFDSLDEGFARFWRHRSVRDELLDLLGILDRQSATVAKPLALSPGVALSAHARYSRDEVLAAFGLGDGARLPQLREGVKWVEGASADLFFVTLNKSERDYSPTTMYRDYAISPSLFHWESQSTLGESAPTAQRYIHHAERGSSVLLFVRRQASRERGFTEPYFCLGPAEYVSHKGERPLAITWQLADPMPESLFETARAVAVA
jgi:superfamily II DNA or RNA helicase/HKD family nuclease